MATKLNAKTEIKNRLKQKYDLILLFNFWIYLTVGQHWGASCLKLSAGFTCSNTEVLTIDVVDNGDKIVEICQRNNFTIDDKAAIPFTSIILLKTFPGLAQSLAMNKKIKERKKRKKQNLKSRQTLSNLQEFTVSKNYSVLLSLVQKTAKKIMNKCSGNNYF